MRLLRPEQTPFLWLVLGYGIMFGGFYYGQTLFGFVGLVLAVVGLFLQTVIAKIGAQPFTFLKSPVRSFYQLGTVVKQFQFSDPPVTNHGTKESAYGKNLSVIKLDAPDEHPEYHRQDVLVVAHDGEWTDHISHEKGEVNFWGVAGVSHNKTDIVELWETPETYSVAGPISPVYVFGRGGGKGDYDRWIHGEFAKMEAPQRSRLRSVLESLAVAK